MKILFSLASWEHVPCLDVLGGIISTNVKQYAIGEYTLGA